MVEELTNATAGLSVRVTGWTSVVLSTAIASVWAFWGVLENFHEGWYWDSTARNLAGMLAYLSFMLFFIVLALVAIRWPPVGAVLHAALALFATWFFWNAHWTVVFLLIAAPLLLLAVGYLVGRPLPQRRAAMIIIGCPLITALACGIEPAIRVAGRLDDADRGARLIVGNGVSLMWAPAGPGWPTEGMSWHEAVRRCAYLRKDGTGLAETPQNIWRLPSAEEAVRSMHRHGENCNGRWDPTAGKATYDRKPDKESPLWDARSPIIYWWTATEIKEQEAYIVVYDGRLWPRPKDLTMGSLAFRAVRVAP
jgi:hypothetical protein